MYAEIAVNLNLESTFDYLVPPHLAGQIAPGHLVEVQFGGQRAQGVVLGLRTHSAFDEVVRPVDGLIVESPVLTPQQIHAAHWLSERYQTNISSCAALFLPPGLGKKGDILLSLRLPIEEIETRTETQRLLVKLLGERGPLRGRQVARVMPRRDWRAAVAQLSKRGALARQSVLLPPTVSPRMIRTARLAIPPAQLEEAVAQHIDTRTKAGQRRAQVLRYLCGSPLEVPISALYQAVPGTVFNDLRVLAGDDLLMLGTQEHFRDPLEGWQYVPRPAAQLLPDQQAAWEAIAAAFEAEAPRQPFLLHGVTGSGKTEIYLRAIERALALGRSAMLLVPEIALTPQVVKRLGGSFPGRMALVHSRLSPGERYDTWRRIRAGHFDVIVGARSALFSPVRDLGVLIIDECHDDSFKNAPPIPAHVLNPPFFHALDLAEELAKLHNAPLILGSATPNVITYARAQSGSAHLLRLPRRVAGHAETGAALPELAEMPPVKVVDMRQELKAGSRSMFSRALTASLRETFSRGEQAILFWNRRGTATVILCRSCGYTLTCPRCDAPLTWHMPSAGHSGFLLCHHCNYRQVQPPKQCPHCGSEHIRYLGGGTEKVEQEVRQQFEGVRTLRWDRDTATKPGAHEAILARFLAGEADVLIGTQMIAKGLDLPLVTLVGVINADTGLFLPDYRSGERTFQLLTQVAGRAGRSARGGRAIFQTYNPDHYAIKAAAEHDFEGFYRLEKRYRAEMGYPPFSRLARLVFEAEQRDQAEQQAREAHAYLVDQIQALGMAGTTHLIGPAPCFFAKVAGWFRWHVIIRGPAPEQVLPGIPGWPRLTVDLDPASLL